MNQPIKYHGGKHYLAKRIIELMPPHLHYVEPYFGGGSVLLAKDPEGVSEVVNDLNHELAVFWSVLRDSDLFDAFKRVVDAVEFSEQLFQSASNAPVLPYPFVSMEAAKVDRAVRFFIRARQSRQGLMKDFATLSRNRTRRGMNEQVSSWLTAIDGLPEVHARLKRVVILNRPALEVIRQQDGENTLVYADPPYLHETRATTDDYEHEMTTEDHIALLETLSEIDGKFILSGYPSALYSQWERLAGWRRVDIAIDNKASSKTEKEIKTECLWMNY